MKDLAVFLIVMGKVQTLAIVSAFIAVIVAVGVTIAMLRSRMLGVGFGEDDVDNQRYRALKKPSLILCIVAFVFVCLAVAVPSRTELITIAIAGSLDEYNTANPASMLSPDGALGTVDNVLKTVDMAVEKLQTLLK
jgi:formate hydrogenlyase subunit 3/multisubunit Na+/H+ antiporter MnhD subunit